MKVLFCFIFLSLILTVEAQQDPQYSQYMFNRTVINPAYIGSRDVAAAALLIKKEWVNVNGSPQTNNVSFSSPLKKAKNMALGGHVVQESIGPKKWISAYADYAYRVRLGEGMLSFGIAAGAVAYDFNPAQIDLYDKNEPALNNDAMNRALRFDAACGAYYYTRTFYAGLSATHLTAPQLFESKGPDNRSNSFYALERHIFLTIGKGFRLNDNLVFNPSVMVKTVMGRNVNADLNLCFIMKQRFAAGVSVRSSYNLVALAQYYINDRLRIGYSFDYGLKGISRVSYGSHELAINFDFISTKSKITTTRLL